MESIIIGIKRCKECPHFKTGNQWSSDGWDRMEDWICGKENKKIQDSWWELRKMRPILKRLYNLEWVWELNYPPAPRYGPIKA